jgi:hypothetical protein
MEILVGGVEGRIDPEALRPETFICASPVKSAVKMALGRLNAPMANPPL